MKKTVNIFVLVGAVLLLLAGGAQASTYIDFRLPGFSGALDAQPDFFTTVDGFGLTFTPLPEDPNTKLWWDSEDGIGVQSDVGYEPDEIEGAERLRLDFSNTLYLNKVYITDLFIEWGYVEIGRIQVDDNKPEIIEGVQIIGATNGELTVEFGPNLLADYILFSAPGLGFGPDENHEFSVGGVEVAAVPLPPALILLGSGILGLGIMRKKFKDR